MRLIGRVLWSLSAFFFPGSFLQATSDKTASANFTQTSGSVNARGIANNLSNGKTGYNSFFQWGRKDAFRSAEYTTAPSATADVKYSATSVTVGKVIQTPTTHYYGTGSNNYIPYYNNAWNATYTSYSTETTSSPGLDKVVKTVYDPCPVGYTVPPANAFISFTNDNMSVDGNCRSYTSNGKKLNFPLAGRRSFNSAEIANVGTVGYYHGSIFGTDGNLRVMYMTSSVVYPCSTTNGHGIATSSSSCVRPVREK